MKIRPDLFLAILTLILLSSSLYGQKAEKSVENITLKTDFSDRQAIINTTKNFFIGDHKASVKHKKLSMHKNGAYRYIDKNGAYAEFKFNLDSAEADTSYKEEVLSIDIYENLALVRVRLAVHTGGQHYKLLTLHKAEGEWKITTITWGSGITL